jgi:hypothetical protein
MLVVGPVIAVLVHSVGSSVVVVTASEHWFSASGAVAVASKIEGATFALACVAGSSAVA